jgi:predicted nucleic acid-binding Zn ribbon protein
MARKDDFRGNTMRCVVCTNPIPPERKWDAITCSKECTKARRDFGRSRKDMIECRYCMRPSTPEERARYLAWRRAERKSTKETTDEGRGVL